MNIHLFSQAVVLLILATCAFPSAEITSGRMPSIATSETSGPVVIRFKSEQRSISSNAPIWIAVSIINETDSAISLDLGQNFETGFRFTIVRRNGPRSELSLHTRDGWSQPGTVRLEPKDVYRSRILLNKWFSSPKAMCYTFRGGLSNPIYSTNGEVIKADVSDSFQLCVTPENAKQLRSLSKALAHVIVDPNVTYQDASTAAEALSYIRNPVAVASMESAVVENPMVASILIPGLRAIRGKSAKAALKRLSRSDDEDTSKLAMEALSP